MSKKLRLPDALTLDFMDFRDPNEAEVIMERFVQSFRDPISRELALDILTGKKWLGLCFAMGISGTTKKNFPEWQMRFNLAAGNPTGAVLPFMFEHNYEWMDRGVQHLIVTDGCHHGGFSITVYDRNLTPAEIIIGRTRSKFYEAAALWVARRYIKTMGFKRVALASDGFPTSSRETGAEPMLPPGFKLPAQTVAAKVPRLMARFADALTPLGNRLQMGEVRFLGQSIRSKEIIPKLEVDLPRALARFDLQAMPDTEDGQNDVFAGWYGGIAI